MASSCSTSAMASVPGTRRATCSASPTAPVRPSGRRWGSFHPGIDIGVLRTDAVHAALDGVVVGVGWLPHYEGYGNVVELASPGRIVTLYAHLARALVHRGQHVRAGELIGRAG